MIILILLTLPLYEGKGLKAILKAHYGIISCTASMEEVKKVKVNDKEAVLVRGKIDKFGGLVGFIIRLLKLYKGEVIFDTYIDVKTHFPIRSRTYNKKNALIESIYYDRENNRIKSILENKVIENIPQDTQDATSILMNFLYLANNSPLYIDKIMEANMLYEDKVEKVIVKITEKEETSKGVIYTFTSIKLPEVTKYPVILSVKLLDDGNKVIPIQGYGIVKIPIIGKIEIKGEIEIIGL